MRLSKAEKKLTEKKQVMEARRQVMPERIPDTPENVAQALLTTPPKKAAEWAYLKKRQD